MLFQFLGRNSGRSDSWYPIGSSAKVWKFQFLGRNSGRSDMSDVFLDTEPFNLFQFLGRNSGRSDETDGQILVGDGTVSIPRSEFWSFGRRLLF